MEREAGKAIRSLPLTGILETVYLATSIINNGEKSTVFEQDLQQCRQAIDALDTQILNLLAERTAVVEQVAAIKKRQGNAVFMRPAREAQIIRRLLDRKPENIPSTLIYQLWREIMMASLQLEKAFAVTTHTSCLHITRDHFGSATPLRVVADTAMAIQDVQNGKALLAVLPDPTTHPWWLTLPENMRMVFRLPFLGTTTAFAVGDVPIEASGDDETYVVMDIAYVPVDAEVIATVNDQCLLRLTGFHTPETLSSLTTGRYLGSIARPITPSQLND